MKKTADKLWIDYLELLENYKDELTIPEMAHEIFKMTSKMVHDCAPTSREANDLIYRALLSGQAWSDSEKEARGEE